MAIKINVNFKPQDKGQVSQPVLKPVNPLWNKNVTPSPVIPRLNTPTSAPAVPRLQLPQATTNRIQTMKESALDPQKPTLRIPFNYKDSQQGSRGTLTAEAQRIALEQTPAPIAGTLGGIGSAFGIKNTPEQEQYLKDTKKGYGAYSVAGNIIGQIGGYGAVNATLKGTKLGATLVSTLGKKLGDKAGGYVASQGAQLLADAIVQAPMETVEAIQNDKSIGEDVRQILTNRAIDLAMNMAIQGGSDAFKKMMANKKVMQAVVDAGVPESEIIRAIETNDQQAIREIQNKVNIKGKEYEVSKGTAQGSIPITETKPSLTVASGQKVVKPEFALKKPTENLYIPTQPRDVFSIEDRSITNVGKTNLKPYSQQNQEVVPFYKEAAKDLKADLLQTVKGQQSGGLVRVPDGRGSFNDRYVDTSTSREASESVTELLETLPSGPTYKQIEESLDRIATGQSKNALDKQIEVIIDKRLTKGFRGIDGTQVKPDGAYINAKALGEFEATAPPIKLESPITKRTLTKVPTVTTRKELPKLTASMGKEPVKLEGYTLVKEPKKITPELKPVESPKKPPIEDTRSRVMVEPQSKVKGFLRDKAERVYQELTSTNVPFEKMDGQPKILAANRNRVQGTVEYNIANKQTDMSGLSIGKSADELFKGLEGETKKDFYDYALNKHNLQRANPETYVKKENLKLFNKYKELKKQLELNPKDAELLNKMDDFKKYKSEFEEALSAKPVFGKSVGVEKSAETVKRYEASNKDFAEKQKEVTQYFENFKQEWGVKSGLISKKSADALTEKYPNYVPTYRAMDIPKGMADYGQNVSKFTKEATGSERFILPMDEQTKMITARIIRNARKNELMNAVYDAYKIGDSKVSYYVKDIKPLPKEEVTDVLDIGKAMDEAPQINGDNYVVNFYKDGEPMQMTVNKTLYKALETANSDDVVQQIAGFIRKNATNRMKAVITGYNPLFTASNAIRDAITALVYSSNPLKMAKNFPEATKQILENSTEWQRFQALGGTKAGIVGSEKSISNTVKGLPVIKQIGQMNDFVEALPRFSEYLTVLQDTGNPMLAMYRAAELTTDFSRHGRLTKLVDSGVPYLNPSVQGIDRFARGIIKNPIKTATRAGLAITVPTIILDQINKDNKNYQELPARERNNYFHVSIPNSDKFLRLPKSRELGVLFGTLYDWSARAARGEEVTGKEIASAIKENFTPVDVASSAIWLAAQKSWNQIKDPEAYETNYWGSLIVPESQRQYSPGQQYDMKSSGIAKAIGKQFNVSPFVIDYFLSSYSGIIGQVVQPIGADKKTSVFTPILNKFVTDPVMKSDNVTKFYTLLDKKTKDASDYNKINDIDSKIVTPLEKDKNALLKISKELSDYRKQQRELQVSDNPNRDALVRELQRKMNDLARKALEGAK